MRTRSFLSPVRPGSSSGGRGPRLSKAAVFAKRNRLLLAGLAAVLTPGTADAAGIEGAWHVGPRPAVRAICHAGDSLWVGTAAGLFIVDVRSGSVIERIDAGSRLPSSSVRAIASAGDSVFVATDDGLSLFRGGKVRLFTPRTPQGLPAASLRRLNGVAIGRGREILLATLGRGAAVITAAGAYTITRRDSLLDDIVFDVRDRPGGPRYYATNAGLCAQFDDTTFVWYQAGAGLPRGEARQLAVAPDGVLHVLVSRQGIYRFDRGRAVLVTPPDGFPLRDAQSISAGADGALWAAGRGWVAVRRGNRWSRVDTGAPADAVWRTVVADGAGAFAGSSDGMVVAMDRGSPMRVDLGAGLPAPRADAIAADGRGAAWFVSGGHLVRADATTRQFVVEDTPPDARAVTIARDGSVIAAGRWTVRQRGAAGWSDMRPDVLGGDPAYTAARADADGALWIGTRSGAIYRYDGEIWLRMARGAETLDGRGIHAVRSAPGGTWAIGAGVPVRCVDGGVERFSGIDSSETVMDLERSPAGDWVAVTAKRLFVFDDAANVWRPREAARLVSAKGKDAGAAAGEFTAIAFDASGNAFLGSTEGLGVVSAAGVRWLRAADGTGGGEVADIVVDGDRLWIGFAREGITVLPLAALK